MIINIFQVKVKLYKNNNIEKEEKKYRENKEEMVFNPEKILNFLTFF